MLFSIYRIFFLSPILPVQGISHFKDSVYFDVKTIIVPKGVSCTLANKFQNAWGLPSSYLES